MDLKSVRNNIDEIDDQLHSLIIKRMKLSEEVARCKLEENLPVFNAERESEIVKRLRELSPKPYQDSVYSIYCQILSESKALQRSLIAKWTSEKAQKQEGKSKIAIQGTKGAYSQMAALALFDAPELFFQNNFNDVFERVIDGSCDYGLIPIENSCAGSVTDNYDLLLKYDVKILKTVSLRISHHLLAKKGARLEDIKRVYSHAQAINQCSEFFFNNPQIEKCYFSNTARAAELVASREDKDIAAIASELAMNEYGLVSLSDKIQDKELNLTRFALIGRNSDSSNESDGTTVSLALRLSHEPSALYNALGIFAKNGVNLQKLQSRPIPACPFEFMFFIDLEGSIKDKSLQKSLEELMEKAEYLKLLGCYDEVKND